MKELTNYESKTIARALRVMERNLSEAGEVMSSPQAVRDYLRLRLGLQQIEVFTVLFLDARHRLIEARDMFRGTLTQTAVYPREVARAALELNAAAVILSHNHPSGVAQASAADRALTDSLRSALSTLDHIIVAGRQSLSFAERGWM